MKISVVMATYNGERFLKEQLDSIRLQTQPADEVIICDDCSTDNTAVLVQSYIKENRLEKIGWTFSINQENIGFIRNFIGALEKASGDILFFADQDDIWMLDKIKSMSQIMGENENILCLSGGNITIDEDGRRINFITGHYMSNLKYWSGNIAKTKRLMYLQGCAMCLRASIAKVVVSATHALVKKNAPLCYHDVQAILLTMLLDGAYAYEKPVVCYRIHNNNISKSNMLYGNAAGNINFDERIRYIEEELFYFKEIQPFFSVLGASKEQKKKVTDTIASLQRRLCFLRNKNPFLYIQLWRYDAYYSKVQRLLGDLAYAYGFNCLAGKIYNCFTRLRGKKL